MARPRGPAGGLSTSVESLLERCTFPAAGETAHCAVSGGADSSALLILARAAGCAVIAHHVDHGLRAESSEEAAMVAALAERFGADFVAHCVEVEPGPNLEARARTARFGVLPTDVATGHTLDDRAETVLINLLRGGARSGLSPMRDKRRHPIIALRRSETEQLCIDQRVSVIQDPSNADPAFVRNRVRHELLPLLRDISNRDVAALLDRQADIMVAEDDLLDELASTIDATDAKVVAAAPPALARRAIRAFIISNWDRVHPPSSESVERVRRVAEGAARSCQIEGGHRVHRTAQKLRLEPPFDSVASS